ncbi:MAG: metallophosphoesterase [Clostridia bacterium]|nr:metallophosphoesterase [Clostridia bacterium]
MSKIIKNAPAVFAVERNYSILIQVIESSVMWIRVGDECYYDHSNGVLRSSRNIHSITVPGEKLESAGEYTVCYRKMIERKPYFSVTGEVEEVTYAFRPVSSKKLNLYQIADAHGMVEGSVAAAKAFEKKYGKVDLLVLNGDVIDHSGNVENFDAIFEISSGVTGGNIPIVFSRGNYDTRGIYAEEFENYTPTRCGISYYTFRISDVWGLVLDCGEDKLDANEEYGNTNCHEAFRRYETEYLESIIKNKENEYAETGVKKKLIFTHVPFTRRFKPPFNIEEDTYAYWAKLLREEVKPDLMIAGHTHKYSIDRPGCDNDALGQPCTVVVASQPDTKKKFYAGGGVVFDNDKTKVVFSNQNEITYEEEI